MPPTVLVRTRSQLLQSCSFPCFIKLPYSTAGRGVWLLHSDKELHQLATELEKAGLLDGHKEVVVQQPAPGVIPFSINAEQWADFTTANRYVAVPGAEKIRVYDSAIPIPEGFYSGMVFFPKDGVLAKTISIEMERGKPSSRKRLETQVLHNDGTNWHGYSYQWNDEQTDAALVPRIPGPQLLYRLPFKNR